MMIFAGPVSKFVNMTSNHSNLGFIHILIGVMLLRRFAFGIQIQVILKWSNSGYLYLLFSSHCLWNF
jgi:hypothetical protein